MWFIYHSMEDESTIAFGICGKQVFAIVNKQKLSLDVFHKKGIRKIYKERLMQDSLL